MKSASGLPLQFWMTWFLSLGCILESSQKSRMICSVNNFFFFFFCRKGEKKSVLFLLVYWEFLYFHVVITKFEMEGYIGKLISYCETTVRTWQLVCTISNKFVLLLNFPNSIHESKLFHFKRIYLFSQHCGDYWIQKWSREENLGISTCFEILMRVTSLQMLYTVRIWPHIQMALWWRSHTLPWWRGYSMKGMTSKIYCQTSWMRWSAGSEFAEFSSDSLKPA